MHRILEQVCAIAERERAEWLPEVTPQQLEQDGAVFYMNSQNGTEFDWYVNDRLPSFMVFYNDEANLGAVKLHLNRNGTVSVYLYGEQGARLQKQETLPAEYTEEELLGLAVQLRQAADDQRRWDACLLYTSKMCIRDRSLTVCCRQRSVPSTPRAMRASTT